MTCTRIGICLLFALGVVGPAGAQSSAPAKKGTVEKISVHGAALQGNLEGDSPDRDVFIYLPPSYSSNRNHRYPVVYLLHGASITAERWMTRTNMAAAADKDIAAGTMKEMILVIPDAFTKYNGSMYSASITTGDWESYIADDLVAYVDSHYRTIPNRLSRGLGGHSMGGYGTIRIGMKRPDVFGSLYMMSACCLLDFPFAAGNRGGARGQAPEGAFGAAQGDRGAGTGPGRGRGFDFGDGPAQLAAAFSANPKNPPNYFDTPFKDGEPQPLILAKWAANSPLAMIDQYVTNLKKYHAIISEVGLQDTGPGILATNKQMDQILTDFGVTHAFETYEGDHNNRIPERIEQKVLPFFSSQLSFVAPRK
jgi:enterochelin esterase-like enzyme